jgi:hypothetical protein
MLTFVKAVTTDAHGACGFGALRRGHFTLEIEGPLSGDYFDVEITPAAKVD